MKTIYLAGGSSEDEYREDCKLNYGHLFNLIDPMTREFKMIEELGLERDPATNIVVDPPPVLVRAIVEQDKGLIDTSDILVSYVKEKTFGTIMETIYAYDKGLPVFIINPGGKYKKDVWLSYHSDFMIYDSIEDCFDSLKNIYLNEHE